MFKLSRISFLGVVFIVIGVVIGTILSLQIRADPVGRQSFPLDQLEVRRGLLETFSVEQQELRQELAELSAKRDEAKVQIEQRSSRQMVKTLEDLRQKTGFSPISGDGIRITLADNLDTPRSGFVSLTEQFVQASDIRDLVNALYLQNAKAIAVNGKRVAPLTPIHPIFDSILVGSAQMNPPFVVEVIGHPETLQGALAALEKRKIRVYVDTPVSLTLPGLESIRSFKFLSLIPE